MLFQYLSGFEPIFYTTHTNEEPTFKDNKAVRRIYRKKIGGRTYEK